MAHHKRKRSRKANTAGSSRSYLSHRLGLAPEDVRWMENWPRWHDKIFHTTPRRHKESMACRSILKGMDPDTILWPLDRKPHIYYW